MDSFIDSLIDKNETRIPLDYDFFAPLIGDWDFIYYDSFDEDSVRSVNGEWLFRRALNGVGICDLFICPSRKERVSDIPLDSEYGLTVRVFNELNKNYDVVYACEKGISNLNFIKDGNRLIGTVVSNPSRRWIFSNITDNSFLWQNITEQENGRYIINCEVHAKRRIN